MAEYELERIKALKRFICSAIHYAGEAHEQVFKKENFLAAIGYLNAACSEMAAAKSLYYAKLEELEWDAFEKLVVRFDIFARELLKDYATEHSVQWVDIEYQNLMETYGNPAFSTDG